MTTFKQRLDAMREAMNRPVVDADAERAVDAAELEWLVARELYRKALRDLPAPQLELGESE
ncbi:MAG: hypothetical protein JST65_16195 [Acidobacteria bacterium]|nr:hypothetical protein [Acidobacteriota bacterium]